MAVRVLVTGGAGYIGSHTAKALARAGFEPVVLDDLSTGHAELVRWGPLVRADIGDEPVVRRCLEEHAIAAVIHFAGLIAVGESVTSPRRFVETNVVGTVRLLAAMLDANVKRLVFSSSAAVYGHPATVPIAESQPHAPVSPYGASKAMIERVLEDYDPAYGLRSVRLRYFNAAGADPDGETGELHAPETHLLPLAIDAALGRRGPLDLFGTDYPTPDGTAIRDYVHVTDLAEAHVLAVRHLLEGGASSALNLGTGEGTSVRAAIAAVERATGRAVPVRQQGRRAGDPAVLVADAREARRMLAWETRTSGIDAIVETAVRWHRARA